MTQLIVTSIIKGNKTSAQGKPYQAYDVSYTKNGTPGKKAINQYSPVYKALATVKAGDIIEVEQVQEGGYWNWTSVKVVGQAPVQAQQPSFSGGKNNDQVQVMIIRQSSLNVAVQALTATGKTVPEAQDVISMAKEFESYVLGKEQKQQEAILDEQHHEDEF